MRYTNTEYREVLSVQREVTQAQDDYQRLRAAYLELARNEPDHLVGLAMIGSSMDFAHAHLQALIGLPQLPFTHEPTLVVRREAQRMAAEESHEALRPRKSCARLG